MPDRSGLADVVDLSDVDQLLDVGDGSRAIELCLRFPSLRADVYALPLVCERAAVRVARERLADRIGFHPGDFFDDEVLPSGYDAILLTSVPQARPEAELRALAAKCFGALPFGGWLMICEPVDGCPDRLAVAGFSDVHTAPLAAGVLVHARKAWPRVIMTR
jgi:hypothetical protein